MFAHLRVRQLTSQILFPSRRTIDPRVQTKFHSEWFDITEGSGEEEIGDSVTMRGWVIEWEREGTTMAFSDFKYPDVLREFGLTWQTAENLFAGVQAVPPTPSIREVMAATANLATTINTEKARSEWMIAPVLGDFWSRYHGQISLFSGADFDADPAAKLNGYCDFIVTRAPQQPQIISPVMVIFEAKRENINDGLGQCIAGMLGAQRFNQRNNTLSDPIFGCVTNGSQWKFLRLLGNNVAYDLREYYHGQPELLLGILTHVVGPPPATTVAA